jgi:phage repressor protein C with HTH and peptisase S24 domain/DNA-binding XRE family transcriptional regulator
MNNIELIKKIRKISGLTQEQFAEKIGLKKGSYANIEAGIDPLIDRTINAIRLAFPEISSEYLNNKNDAPIKKIQPSPALKAAIDKQKKRQLIEKKPLDSHLIPLVSAEVAAGFGSESFAITKEDIQGSYLVPDFNGIDFMIRVKGNSMYPKYSSGDIIACRKITDNTFLQWNKCHVIATREQGLIVKRIRKSDNPECIIAVSDNKEYEIFEIPKTEITGLALVIGVIRLE